MSMMEAVAGTAADLGLLAPAEAEPTVPNSDTAAAPETHETAIDYNPVLPDDLQDLLDEPDDTDLDPVSLDEYHDPEELARELARARKQNEYLQNQVLSRSRKEWIAEARKFCPLADVDTITATSRRGFLREAKRRHDTNYQLLKPQLDRLAADTKAAELAKADAERAAAERGWGRPVTGAGGPPPSTTQDERIAAARERRSLTGAARALIDSRTI